MARAFKYHRYKCFGSQIELTKIPIVMGKPGNSQNKNVSDF